MTESNETAHVRREALRLLAQVEQQGLDIARAYQDGSDVSSRFTDFRRFVEKVEHFYVFVDLVEDRLPKFEDDKRAVLKKHLADIRWRIVIVEVDTTQIFLVRIGEANAPWPLGSRQFLQRRLDRLGEIQAYYDAFGDMYQLTPLSEVMIRAVTDLIRAQLPKTTELRDFEGSVPLVRPEEMTVQLDRGGARKRRAPPSSPPRPPAPPFRVREMSGRFYADRDGIVAVSEACRVANMSLDDLARQMGMSRQTLVLLLSGTDSLARAAVDELRSFVKKHGGSYV